MSDFFDAIRRFLLDYLPKQRCLILKRAGEWIAGWKKATAKTEMNS